jgi:ABC-type transporter Mla subunit MlaD
MQGHDVKPERHRTPRWVYLFGFLAVVLLVLIVSLHLAGAGMGEHTYGVQQP